MSVARDSGGGHACPNLSGQGSVLLISANNMVTMEATGEAALSLESRVEFRKRPGCRAATREATAPPIEPDQVTRSLIPVACGWRPHDHPIRRSDKIRPVRAISCSMAIELVRRAAIARLFARCCLAAGLVVSTAHSEQLPTEVFSVREGLYPLSLTGLSPIRKDSCGCLMEKVSRASTGMHSAFSPVRMDCRRAGCSTSSSGPTDPTG